MIMSRILRIAAALVLLTAPSIQAGSQSPIKGAEYDVWIAGQDLELQKYLETFFSEEEGFLVCGPLEPGLAFRSDVAVRVFLSHRVVCPDLAVQRQAIRRMQENHIFQSLRIDIDHPRKTGPAGFRGVTAMLEYGGRYNLIQLNTVNQTRWLIWFLDAERSIMRDDRRTFDEHATAVSDYLYAIDQGQLDAPEPKAADFGLAEELDFYAPPPDYVIQGYQNYKDYLYGHSEIVTDFARGITAFIPTDSLLAVMKVETPLQAYPNKEAPMLQQEYRKFFDRGGDVRVMRTLTAEVFAGLKPGEYFYAVGLSGKIRFGRELLREEVERLEQETGRKVPRANHAFLFPGEPILTAGAFFIEGENPPRLVRVNAHSGHYFYSNVTPTIREDISMRSNEYLLTLGCFFSALDRLGIAYDSILISKF